VDAVGRPAPVRLIWYAGLGSAVFLAVLALHRSWLPISVLFAVAIPVVDRTKLRRLPRHRESNGSRAEGDPLLEALKSLEAEGYRVLSKTGSREGSIDHIVVGPPGVFTIERNDWTGRFSLRRDGWFQHSKHDAGIAVWHANQHVTAIKGRLRSIGLRVPVHGLVAVTAGRVSEGAIDMGQVLFLPAADVASYVRSRHRALNHRQVAQVARAILKASLPSEPGQRASD
jgi:hypothetical protein